MKVGVGDIVGIVVGLVRVGLRLRGTGNLLGWHEMGSLERKLVGCLAMIEESIVDSSVGRTEGDFVGRTLYSLVGEADMGCWTGLCTGDGCKLERNNTVDPCKTLVV